MRSYITKALGAGVVHFDIHSQPFLSGDACWLVSDGFYNTVHSIGQELPQLWKNAAFEKGASQLFTQYAPHYQDDASVVALRRNDEPAGFAQAYEAWVTQKYTLPLPATLHTPALIRTIFEAIRQGLANKAVEQVLDGFALFDKLDISLDLDSVESLLQAFAEAQLNHQGIYKEIRALLLKATK